MKSSYDEAKVLWVDFLANGPILHNEKKRVSYISNAVQAGFTHIVIDAKIPYGYVTYISEIAPHVGQWDRFKEWAGMDYVALMLEAAEGSGLKVILKVDVFAEGIIGAATTPKKEWQITYYHEDEKGNGMFTLAENFTENAIFVNPAHPEVRKYELSIIQELIKNHPCDAIVLDRCRYPNIHGDFSNLSKQQFQTETGQIIQHWPQDIVKGSDPVIFVTKETPPLLQRWLAWRAGNIRSFVEEAKAVVKGYGEGIGFGVYVGSWHPEFFHEGVNWGSEDYEAPYEWVDQNYAKTGYAEELDFLMTGCYYPDVTVAEAQKHSLADWKSVEGAIELSKLVTKNRTSLLPGLFLYDYEGDKDQFNRALNICAKNSSGLMIFDAIYLEKYNWWDILIKRNRQRA